MSADGGRKYAQILKRIWRDDDWRQLSVDAQWLYTALLSQDSINYAGVLAITVRRWANLAKDMDPRRVESAIDELAAHRFVVVDWDTEEVLVRTYIRNDGLWKQPRMMGLAVRQALETTSQILRTALADELKTMVLRIDHDATSAICAEAVDKLSPPQVGGAEPGPSAGGGPGHREGVTPSSGVGTYVSSKEYTSTYTSTDTTHRSSTRPPDDRPPAEPEPEPETETRGALALVPDPLPDRLPNGRRIPKQTRHQMLTNLNATARSAAADQLVRQFEATLDGNLDRGTMLEVAQVIDRLFADGIDPQQIANGLTAWHQSDRLYPSQIPRFVAKAARSQPRAGKPTASLAEADLIAEQLKRELEP